jgi:hypothetical protein
MWSSLWATCQTVDDKRFWVLAPVCIRTSVWLTPKIFTNIGSTVWVDPRNLSMNLTWILWRWCIIPPNLVCSASTVETFNMLTMSLGLLLGNLPTHVVLHCESVLPRSWLVWWIVLSAHNSRSTTSGCFYAVILCTDFQTAQNHTSGVVVEYQNQTGNSVTHQHNLPTTPGFFIYGACKSSGNMFFFLFYREKNKQPYVKYLTILLSSNHGDNTFGSLIIWGDNLKPI